MKCTRTLSGRRVWRRGIGANPYGAMAGAPRGMAKVEATGANRGGLTVAYGSGGLKRSGALHRAPAVRSNSAGLAARYGAFCSKKIESFDWAACPSTYGGQAPALVRKYPVRVHSVNGMLSLLLLLLPLLMALN